MEDEAQYNQLNSREKKYVEKVKKRRKLIAECITDELLDLLEEHFECHLPCFQVQKNGGFDPLDAIRRDSERGVILWLRSEKEKFNKKA